MTQDEFIAGYCKRSKASWEFLSKFITALPCSCGSDDCKGWAMVSNEKDLIEEHTKLYAPKKSNKEGA